MSHQTKTTRIMLVSIVVLALIGVGAGLDFFQVFAQSQTCSDGGNWHKIEAPGPYTYTAGSGEIIDAVCIKGGSDGSSNGYFQTFTSDGWYQVGDPLKNCVGASGIGTNSASALQGDASGNICAGISHASFRVAVKEVTPTNTVTEPPKESTPTPTNTPVTPTSTPTETVTEPPKESTPTPTGTVTEPPKEETPTPTNTEPPKEETPTPDPTDPAESTESKTDVDQKPDAAAGGSGPSLGSIITLLSVSGASVGLVSYLVSKTKNKENIIQ